MRRKYYHKNELPPSEMTGQGRLQIGCFSGNISRPVSTALVQIAAGEDGTKIIEEMVTDSSGQTLTINLPTPPPEYSLQVDQPKPYSTYHIRVQMDGYEPCMVNGVQIFPNTTASQNINLTAAGPEGAQPQVIFIPEPVLWGDYPPKIPENAAKTLPSSTGFVVLSNPVIPEFIVVHSGALTNKAAQNYTVPFKDYIKNVASCEIYATWPENTIKSNVLAIISFTLNRVYTEWYRSKGFDFTVTNSTALDQAFTYGRNIFDEISVIVDDLFTTYITKPAIRQPLFAQYCDGRKSTCPNWLSQWGSKQLGEQGYSHVDILKNYYGYDIYLQQAEKVAGLPSSFSGTTLQMGSSGPEVRIIQEQLNVISDNYPAIQKVKEDGVYGNDTRMDVEKFQKVFRLPTSGMVDFATWYKVSEVYVAVTKMAELT